MSHCMLALTHSCRMTERSLQTAPGNVSEPAPDSARPGTPCHFHCNRHGHRRKMRQHQVLARLAHLSFRERQNHHKISFVESKYRETVRQKIIDAQAMPLPALTRRDVHLPHVPRKAIAVIGVRFGGKTIFLWQELARRHAAGTPCEAAHYRVLRLVEEQPEISQRGLARALGVSLGKIHPDKGPARKGSGQGQQLPPQRQQADLRLPTHAERHCQQAGDSVRPPASQGMGIPRRTRGDQAAAPGVQYRRNPDLSPAARLT